MAPTRLLPLFFLLTAFLLVATPAAADERTVRCDGPCTLVVKKLGTAGGVVRGTGGDRTIDCGLVCVTGTDYDDRVVLTATPETGAVFTGWIGGCESRTDRSCTVHMVYGPITYYAVFDRAGDPPTPLTEPTTNTPPSPPPPPPPPTAPPPTAPSRCTIVGTGGADLLVGTSGRDVVCARGGADHVHGGGGQDVILGGPGDDELEGNGGADEIVGGGGRDALLGGAGGDVLRARDGFRDRVRGGTGRDRAYVDARDHVRGVERR